MIIPCTATLVVTRAGDTVQVELPTGDKLILSPESARDAAWSMMRQSEFIQLELAEKRAEARKNAREAGR